MNLKITLLVMLFITNIFASNFNATKLTKEEIKTLKEIKKQGEKYGLSYSLMAIAVKESSIGKYLVNVDSKDYGLYQANIKTVLSRQKAKNTSWNRNKYAMRLISDFKFATKNAIAELNYWKKVHKNDWKKVWSSYNGGWKYNSKKARNYSREIAIIIKKLKRVNV
ncbi:lytic transglycosylase domain-containing protein [Poseidonibacter lekithochrous]|uniref:transglycosylase SLT domain-containing protein n=1 Tax=Poseidonibacter TaxID=2321187 RepID=UPI001C09782D|nr:MULTISPECIES: transglycosylase SLT domain-containing protein [Poseidonibacter]MBU3015249.1 lytic transglycosylase domain-containing protein [Poseidonibacter lekithochrous]MDO6828547.1 transglycosylase SLT domain-containing protein [Poseidonibacter sp. 1_MG-2023]